MATYLPFSDVIAAYGYRQRPPARPRGNVLLLALAYVIMGSALGTVAGTGLAMATFHSNFPTLVFQDASAVQASTAIEHVVTPPTPPSPVAQQAVVEPVSVALVSTPKLAKPSPIITRQHAETVHAKALGVQAAQKVVPAVVNVNLVHVTTAEPVAATVVDASTRSYRFFSEGDATIADFDASAGRIETYDGRTFVIGASAAASASASLQDSGSSVHYRCDQNGNCTLVNAGQVMQNVRLM
jgi:hypothetical protein